MDYKQKFLKYQNKYQNLLKLVGGSDPDLQRAIQQSELEYALKQSEIDEATRRSLQQKKYPAASPPAPRPRPPAAAEPISNSEINAEFERRLRDARILVIGASFKNNFDDIRWSRIDPNFLGISHSSRDPIGKLGSWDDNPHEYWHKVFGEILRNRKFDAIYLDRGTFQYLVHEIRHLSGRTTFNYESFKILVEYIYHHQITDSFYLEFDLLNLDNKMERKIPYLLRMHSNYKLDFEDIHDSYETSFRKLLTFFRQYFKCCGDTQDIIMHLNKNGEEIFSKWIAYLRK